MKLLNKKIIIWGFVFFFFVMLVVLIQSIDLYKFSVTKFLYKKQVRITGINGFGVDNKKYITTNDDPFIVIDYDSGAYVDLNMEFKDPTSYQNGYIYYAEEGGDFSEESKESFTFKTGHNYIRVNRDRINRLRIDITDHKDVEFSIENLYEYSPVLYALQGVNWGSIFIFFALTLVFQFLFWNTHNYKNRIEYFFWEILIISVFFILGKFICNKAYYMYYDVGADTIHQYYPFFVNEVLKLKSGTFDVWNWCYGLGTNILNTNAWAMDPFGLVPVFTGVIFGVGYVSYSLVWMQIIKVVVLFVLSKKYFSLFLTDVFSINISAYIFAFNGYLFLWGQHYFLGTACFYIILILFAIENYLNKKCKDGEMLLVFAIALTMIFSCYIGYMIAIVSGFYFIYRYFTLIDNTISVKQKSLELGRTVVIVFCGMLMSGIVLMPSIYYLRTNSRRLDAAADNVFLDIIKFGLNSFNINDIGDRLSRFISNNALGINYDVKMHFANYYEAPILFFTITAFFFIGQWGVYEIRSAKADKAWISFAIKFLAFYFLIFSDASGYILNGLVYPAYRYTFVLMPFFSLMIGIVFQEILKKKKVSLIGIVIGAVLSVIAWLHSYMVVSGDVKKFIVLIGFILVIAAVLLVAIYKIRDKKNVLIIVFAFLVIGSNVLDNWYTTVEREFVRREDMPLRWTNDRVCGTSGEAISWIKNGDLSFYRLEKTYADWDSISDSFLEQYSTPVCYNSTLNKKVEDYYHNIYPGSATSMSSVMEFRLETELDQVANDIINTKYLLSRDELNDSNWKEMKRFNDIIVYKNMRSDSIAKWYTKTVEKSFFESLSDDEKANVLSDSVVVDKQRVLDSKSDCLIGEFRLKKQTELAGKVSNSSKGILMIGIPDVEGWNAYVDGEKTEIVNCDYGFIGIELPSGDHQIILKYSVPLCKAGLICSLFGIFLFILYRFSKRNMWDIYSDIPPS